MTPRAVRNLTAIVALCVGTLATTPALFGAAPAGAAPALTCSASTVSTRHSGYLTETVHVQTAPRARVVATTHYRLKTRVSMTTADGSGRAILSFRNSTPQSSFHVITDVTVRLGAATGRCVSAFAPA